MSASTQRPTRVHIETTRAERGNYAVELIYLGAGERVGDWSAQLDEDDPILRYDILVKDSNGAWGFFDDAAHYTNIDGFADVAVRQAATQYILDKLYPRLASGKSDLGDILNEIETTRHEVFERLMASDQVKSELDEIFEGVNVTPKVARASGPSM